MAVMDSSHVVLLICAIVAVVYINKIDADPAAPGALGSNCTVASNCSSVANATCSTAKGNICQCVDAFKESQSKCVPKVVNDNCTGLADCFTSNHLTCNTTANKCKCADGYKESGVNCIPKDVGDDCKAIGDCPTTSHLECDTAVHKCKCVIGYQPEGGKCSPNALGTPCGPSNASLVCIRANSMCSPGGKCSCKNNTVVEDGNCPLALGQVCTKATDCVKNSECDTKSKACKCKAGFDKTNGLCSKPSSAVSPQIAMSSIAILIMLNFFLKMF